MSEGFVFRFSFSVDLFKAEGGVVLDKLDPAHDDFDRRGVAQVQCVVSAGFVKHLQPQFVSGHYGV